MTSRAPLLSLSLLAVLWTGHAEEEQRPLVETKYGTLRGISVPVKETPRTADVFFGVPFAKPPVGLLRFKNPEGPEHWSSPRDASQYPPMCLQSLQSSKIFAQVFKSSFEFPRVSEDCLYLNVFTPSDRHRGLRLPVMVYLHGGGLSAGGASMYDGSALSVYEDVVVVVTQYRVGIAGFLSTPGGKLRGNFGFMDQVAALRWVQENIADFGGDPNYVTIFGESAGAISVAAHVLSPLSEGLFHRAVSGSGTLIIPGVLANADALTAYQKHVSELSGCDPAAMVECLMGKSEEEFLAIVERFQWQPASIDGVFLPKPPEEMLANMEINAVPYMLGFCNHEFGWLAPKSLNVEGLTEGMSRESVLRELQKLGILGFSESSPVLDEYLGNATNPLEIRGGFLEIVLDKLFAVPLLRTARYHRDSGNPVYVYEFQHRSSLMADTRPDFVKADHGDDLLYIFGGPFLRDGLIFAGEAPEEEKLLARTVMRYWANFARNGNPSGPGLVVWPPYKADASYLGIDVKTRASLHLKEDKLKFWTEILPERMKRGEHSDL